MNDTERASASGDTEVPLFIIILPVMAKSSHVIYYYTFLFVSYTIWNLFCQFKYLFSFFFSFLIGIMYIRIHYLIAY